MARLNETYDPSEHEAALSRAPFEKGEYDLEITDSDYKQTSNKKGWYLMYEFTVTDGDHAGRKVWHNFNLENQNPTAVEIAKAELRSLCDAVRFTGELEDSDQLHGEFLRAKIGIQPERKVGDVTYDARNRIDEFINPDAEAAKASTTSDGDSDKGDMHTDEADRQARQTEAKKGKGAAGGKAPWKKAS